MNNTKFKSGDKVVFCKSSLESGMIDAKEGDVFTIKESYGPGSRVVSLKELSGDYHKSHFEHYVEKEKVMEKKLAKIGDKIRIVYPACSAGCYEVGDVLEVVGTHEDWVGVDVVIEDGDFFHVYHTEYEVIEDEIVLESNSKPQSEILHEDAQTDWEGSQIDWQVGQEVWDVLHGKGCVKSVATTGVFWVYVDFGRVARLYNKYGVVESYPHEHMNRSLFFSEPKIIAETKPPKKPFTPVFKQGDTIVVKWADTTQVLILEKETEWQVKGMNGEVWNKDPDVHFFKLGEQVKFS